MLSARLLKQVPVALSPAVNRAMQPEHRGSLKNSCSRSLTVAAVAMFFIVGATAPHAAESISASDADRRAQAPAVTVTKDGFEILTPWPDGLGDYPAID